MENWEAVQNEIENCLECSHKGYREVLCRTSKKHPSREPRDIKVLFISEAPPASGAYFYDETRPDGLRSKLFLRLREIGLNIQTVEDFLYSGLFLVPTVKCPSGNPSAKGSFMNNENPRLSVIGLCVDLHLKQEIEFIRPRRIVLLGGVALRGCSRILSGLEMRSVEDARRKSPVVAHLGGLEFEVYLTYWPTPRHGHIEDMKRDFRRALT